MNCKVEKLPNEIWWENIASFKFVIPWIVKQKIDLTDKQFVLIDEISKIPVNRRKNYIVLFFAPDSVLKPYYFNLQTNENLIKRLRSFYAVGGLDFSTYPDIDDNENICAIKKNRRFCVFNQKIGNYCIYNAVWTTEKSFDIAFSNIEAGSVILVNTIRLQMEYLHLFEIGFEELKKRVKPSLILVYGKKLDCFDEDIKTGLDKIIPDRRQQAIQRYEENQGLIELKLA